MVELASVEAYLEAKNTDAAKLLQRDDSIAALVREAYEEVGPGKRGA